MVQRKWIVPAIGLGILYFLLWLWLGWSQGSRSTDLSLFCRHMEWTPLGAIWTDMPDYSLSVSWAAMRCVQCGRVRYSNVLKPRESIVLTVEGIDEGLPD